MNVTDIKKRLKSIASTSLWLTSLTVALVMFSTIFVRGCCITFVDSYELGYRYDLRTGKISRVNHTGYVLHAPLVVEVHTVDLRPMQVCINANSRVLNCKLVQFQEEGLELFLSWHGRNDYESGEGGRLHPILMSYAYDGSGRAYPFLKIVRELKADEKAAPLQ